MIISLSAQAEELVEGLQEVRGWSIDQRLNEDFAVDARIGSKQGKSSQRVVEVAQERSAVGSDSPFKE